MLARDMQGNFMCKREGFWARGAFHHSWTQKHFSNLMSFFLFAFLFLGVLSWPHTYQLVNAEADYQQWKWHPSMSSLNMSHIFFNTTSNFNATEELTKISTHTTTSFYMWKKSKPKDVNGKAKWLRRDCGWGADFLPSAVFWRIASRQRRENTLNTQSSFNPTRTAPNWNYEIRG